MPFWVTKNRDVIPGEKEDVIPGERKELAEFLMDNTKKIGLFKLFP
jgi:hypothetical protein